MKISLEIQNPKQKQPCKSLLALNWNDQSDDRWQGFENYIFLQETRHYLIMKDKSNHFCLL